MSASDADDSAETPVTESADGADGKGPSLATTSRRAFLGGLAAGAAAMGVPTVIAVRSGDDGATVSAPDVSPAPTTSGATGAPTVAVLEPLPTATEVPAVATAAEMRRDAALAVRHRAASLAADMGPPTHMANGDERADVGYAFSFTKGLPHDYETGLVARPADFEQFVAATGSGLPQDFVDTPLGPDDGFRTVDNESPLRAWESQGIGLGYDLIGPDMQAVSMPPAPKAGSAELTGELAEVYAQALLRDELLANLRFDGNTTETQDQLVEALNAFEWFDGSTSISGLPAEGRRRRRTDLNLQTAFRGISPGETDGPYVSQFLLAGTAIPEEQRTIADGLLRYGAQTIDQRVGQAAQVNFLTDWDAWFDVQNALSPAAGPIYNGSRRFITTGRDLASYVGEDALYQSYFNACLVLFSQGAGFDPGMPFIGDDREDHQQGFVLFEEPHVLTMLAEVCMRALKTVKFQKFNVHRRLRPEELAARIEKAELLDIAEISTMAEALAASSISTSIRWITEATSGTASMLLPMAYAEGSPMHPSYGAGHGTVAGACTTVIKALFDHTQPVVVAGSASDAFVANRNGSALQLVPVFDEAGAPAELTVEGEVNKLASNISLGRGWAGVHYFSDHWESLLLGEKIAIQILREHMLTMTVDCTLTVPTFEGDTITLTT